MTKTVLITGCSTGLGFAAARLFAGRGHRVIATVRQPQDAERVASSADGNIHPVFCDVTKAEQVAALPDFVRSRSENGRLDGLINNAGMMLEPGPFELQEMANIRAQFDVNLFGMMAVTQTLLPLLGTNGADTSHRGRIINMSSIEGKVASPFISAYAATKHAIEGFSASLRRELRLFGIKVVIVAPGGIQTEMWRKNTFPVEPVIGTRYEAPYRRLGQALNEMEKQSATADEVARVLLHAFEVRNPKARYAHSKALMDGSWTTLVPDLWYDELVGAMFGLNIAHERT